VLLLPVGAGFRFTAIGHLAIHPAVWDYPADGPAVAPVGPVAARQNAVVFIQFFAIGEFQGGEVYISFQKFGPLFV